jgi:hypothetical protein
MPKIIENRKTFYVKDFYQSKARRLLPQAKRFSKPVLSGGLN